MKSSPKNDYIADFTQLFLTDENQYTCIFGNTIKARSEFLQTLIKNDTFEKYKLLFVKLEEENLENLLKKETADYDLIIIDNIILKDLSEIRTIIKQYLPDIKAILTTNNENNDSSITYFHLPKMTFREYLLSKKREILIPKVLKWEYDMTEFNEYRDDYILSDIEWDKKNFEKIRADIEQELYEKDKEVFDEYLQVMANQVGELYKENEIARVMGVSRRKIRKYTDILLKHNIIAEIFPFGENSDVELTRHTKYFFCDLAYLRAILDDTYYKGLNKSLILENFIYIELLQKLGNSHSIYFWRKKSGTQINFVLVNDENEMLTPVEVNVRSSEHISKAMKSFYELYAEKVEHGMLFNEDAAEALNFEGTSFLILPHIAI